MSSAASRLPVFRYDSSMDSAFVVFWLINIAIAIAAVVAWLVEFLPRLF